MLGREPSYEKQSWAHVVSAVEALQLEYDGAQSFLMRKASTLTTVSSHAAQQRRDGVGVQAHSEIQFVQAF